MNGRSKQIWTAVMGVLAVLFLPALLVGLPILLFVIYMVVSVILCPGLTELRRADTSCADCASYFCSLVVAAFLFVLLPAAFVLFRIWKKRTRLP